MESFPPHLRYYDAEEDPLRAPLLSAGQLSVEGLRKSVIDKIDRDRRNHVPFNKSIMESPNATVDTGFELIELGIALENQGGGPECFDIAEQYLSKLANRKSGNANAQRTMAKVGVAYMDAFREFSKNELVGDKTLEITRQNIGKIIKKVAPKTYEHDQFVNGQLAELVALNLLLRQKMQVFPASGREERPASPDKLKLAHDIYVLDSDTYQKMPAQVKASRGTRIGKADDEKFGSRRYEYDSRVFTLFLEPSAYSTLNACSGAQKLKGGDPRFESDFANQLGASLDLVIRLLINEADDKPLDDDQKEFLDNLGHQLEVMIKANALINPIKPHYYGQDPVELYSAPTSDRLD